MEQRSSGSSNLLYAVLLVVALGIFGVGAYVAIAQHTWTLLAAGALSVIGVLITWPLASMFSAAHAAESKRNQELLSTLNDRLQQVAVMLNVMSEQQLLSDRAKSVAFRDKDREALRRAIREDLARGDYEAAMALVSDMETSFGYKQESQRFRDEISRFRAEAQRKQVADAAVQVDLLCSQEKWTEAQREAERLAGIFPGAESIERLLKDIEARRQTHKKRLLDAWTDALARKDIDGAIDILKKLDLYLTRTEGETMKTAAQAVFKEKLNNLRVAFTLAVQDHKWADAVRIGESIVADFPNSGISREVRDTMETLRRRAAEASTAEVPARV